jgi:CubicO group peptidase (beta-lactamase class C family)
MERLTSADFDRIRGAARDAIQKHHVPGISIGIVEGDDLVFCEALGYADMESKTPMDPDRRQCIASITKTMVALCVMALVHEGRLRLEDRVVDLLPDVKFEPAFDGAPEAMTVWHLLTHTGGIGEAPTVEALRSVVNPDQDAKQKPGGFAEMYRDGIVVEFKPGTKWHYANNGYNLLGEIILRAEKAETLHEVFARRIFEPLGMKDSDLLGHTHDGLTTPYHRAPNEDTREQLTRAGMPPREEATVDGLNIHGKFGGELNKAALAAGGVQSTIPDMARYASALLRRGGGIVSPEIFGSMAAPQYCPNPRLLHWGLGFARDTYIGGRIAFGHGGAYFGGWNSNLTVFPEANVAIVQHMNVMLDSPRAIFNSVKRAVFGEAPPSFGERAIDPAILASAPGLYELTLGRLTNFRPATRIGRVRIDRDGDRLRLTSRWGAWKTGVRMAQADVRDPAFFALPDEAGTGEPSFLALTRAPDGRVTGLRCDDLVHMVRREE